MGKTSWDRRIISSTCERRRTMALIFGVIMAVILISECKPVERCDFCHHSYRISNKNCSTTINDCGDCLKGFEEQEDKFCHYVWNVSHNSSASIIEGDSVVLSCIFEETVSCLWIHQTIVEFNERISYVQGREKNTRDCCIRIRNFEISDIGNWTCSSMGTSEQHGKLKSTEWLNIANSTNELGSLVPKIEVKLLNEYNHLLESERANDKKEETNLWLECWVKSILPVNLYWLVNDNSIDSTANTSSRDETRILLKLLMQTEQQTKTLTCVAEYVNINQTFSDEVTVDFRSVPKNPLMSSVPMYVLIVAIIVFLAAGSVMTYMVYQKHRNNNTEKEKRSVTDSEKHLISVRPDDHT